MTETLQLETVLNHADRGLALARLILDRLNAGQTLTLDFARVERVTPSFANAFIMTLLEAAPVETLREAVKMVNRNDTVAVAINDSVRRYRRGIRLSTQQQPVCA